MQLATSTAAKPIDLRPPHAARPGMPTTQSVMLTTMPTNTPIPDQGFGLRGSLLRFGSALEDARTSARRIADANAGVYAVVAFARRAGDLPSYGVAQLVSLSWKQQGYGGHFVEREARLDGAELLHAITKNGATVLSVFDGAREVAVQRRW